MPAARVFDALRLPNRRRRNAYCLLLLLIFAFFIRIEDLSTWTAAPEVAFVGTEPLLTNFDGYYYLGLARDLQEGHYASIDQQRAVPEGYPRPSTPPLLSWLTAQLARTTSLSLNWLAVLLPAFLGTLIVLPLYGLGVALSGRIAGTLAALLGSTSTYYLTRTSLGWFDTDCLNATFLFLIAFFMLQFGIERRRRRYWYLSGAVAASGLFLWWWDSAPAVVALVFLGTLVATCAALYRPTKKEGLWFLVAVGALLGLLLCSKGPAFFVQIGERSLAYAEYIGKKQVGAFPNAGIAIGEQQRPSLSVVAKAVAGTPWGLVLAGLGLATLAWRQPRKSIVLVVAICSGFLGFFAERFLLFLAPTAALGLGVLFAELWRQSRLSRWGQMATIALLVVSAAPIAYQAAAKTHWPQASPWLVMGLEEAARITEPDAVIWAMSEHGYGINYWARRATISDGSVHGGEHTVYNNLPLAVSDARLSSNFIRFYVTRGILGVQHFYEAVGGPERGFPLMLEILRAGPEDTEQILLEYLAPVAGEQVAVEEWTRFFFPDSGRPICVLVDWRMLKTAYWWYWFGTWDVTTGMGRHPRVQLAADVSISGDVVNAPGEWQADMSTGELSAQDFSVSLSSVVRQDADRSVTISYGRPGGMNLFLYEPAALGVFQAVEFQESLFSRLFFGPAPDERYFVPMAGKLPAFQLYRVTGDAVQAR
jgi:dolichyl-diphosphooligosaccharide--protein glycosyltransferase